MEFIMDILSRSMSLKQVCQKYGIAMNDVLERYHQERAKFTDEEIEEVMQNVYYNQQV